MTELEFAPLSAPLVVLVLGLLGLGAAALYVSYLGRLAPDSAELPSGRRRLLAALRAGALLLLVLLLLEPLLTQHSSLEQPPEVAVLIDDSQSLLATADSQWVRRQRARAVAELQQTLTASGARVQLFSLGRGLEPIDRVDSMTARAPGTNLHAALRQLQARMSGRSHAATVLISDGIATEGADPRYALDPAAPPLVAVLVGDSLPQRDLRLRPLLSNGVATRDVPTPIRAELSATAYPAGQPVSLSLRRGGQVLQTQRVTLGADGLAFADFTFTPTEAGLALLTVVAQGLPGESNLRNNAQRLSLRVLDNRLQVLLLAERPHPDVGALRAALQADARVEVTESIRKGTETAERYAPIPEQTWAKVNLVICHGLPTDPAVVEQLLVAVRRQQLGLAFVCGPSESPQAWARLAEWLPAAPAELRSPLPQLAQPALNEAGRQHATYSFDGAFDRWLADTPPLSGPDAVWRLAPSAQALVQARVQGLMLDAPLLVVAERQQRRQLLWTGQGLWRQRVDAFVQLGSTAAFDTWWQNQVAWLAAARDLRRFSVSPTQATFEGDDAAQLRARVLDERNAPLNDAEVVATISDATGAQRRIELAPTGPGSYTAELAGLPEGLYTYTAEGRARGLRIGTDRGQFAVAALAAEYQRLQADAPLMRQLAVRTGGRFVGRPDIEAAARAVEQLGVLQPRLVERQRTVPLAHTAAALALLLGLLSTEWVLRKRWGLQ